jgi:hypothetical protein
MANQEKIPFKNEVLRNRTGNYLLQFQFRFRLLTSYGYGSGSVLRL